MIRFLFTSLASLAFTLNIVAQDTIFLAKLKTLVDSTDATPIIRDYLNTTNQNAVFVLPEGQYHFYPEKAEDVYAIISNHNNGIVRVGFNLAGKKNLTIDGQGSKLVFYGDIIPFNLENCEGITLKNFSIDWHRTFHSQGEVVAVDTANKTFDIAISEHYPFRIEKDELIWLRDKNQSEWDKNAWIQDVQINLFFDRETKATVYRVKHHKLNPYYPLLHTQITAEEIKPGLVRITNPISELPEPGWVWVSKGGLRPVRLSPAIRLLQAKNVDMENINIHHSGGMGVIAERSENVRLRKVNVVLPPGKPHRIVTTTADATHFVNCKGLISIENCLFENMLDDATNIHGSYLKLTEIIDEHTISAIAPHHEQSVNHFAKAGDTISFRDNTSMEKYRALVVKEFKYFNEFYAEITFEEDVSDLKLNSGMENASWHPEFVMRNCTVRNNRARCILLSSSKSMLIENNQFIRPMMAAISVAGDMNHWFESGNVTNLVIKNNYFEDGATGGFDQAIITVEPVVKNPEKAEHLFHKSIRIENNAFKTFDKAILDCFFTKDLIFSNNTIEQTSTFEPIYPDKPAVHLKYCENPVIENNVFPEKAGYFLLVDENTNHGKYKKNKGLKIEMTEAAK